MPGAHRGFPPAGDQRLVAGAHHQEVFAPAALSPITPPRPSPAGSLHAVSAEGLSKCLGPGQRRADAIMDHLTHNTIWIKTGSHDTHEKVGADQEYFGPLEAGGSQAKRRWPPKEISVAPNGNNGWCPDRLILKQPIRPKQVAGIVLHIWPTSSLSTYVCCAQYQILAHCRRSEAFDTMDSLRAVGMRSPARRVRSIGRFSL